MGDCPSLGLECPNPPAGCQQGPKHRDHQTTCTHSKGNQGRGRHTGLTTKLQFAFKENIVERKPPSWELTSNLGPVWGAYTCQLTVMRYDCSQPSWGASPPSHLLLAQLTGRKTARASQVPGRRPPTSCPELISLGGVGGEPSQSPVVGVLTWSESR